MNLILAIPLEFRVAGLFVLGVCGGSLVNLAVYRLAWRPRSISPWSAPLPGAPPRRADDRIPIFGWLGLSREAPLHGRGFWIRPMLVELLFGAGVAALYWWEIGRLGLRPDLAGQPAAALPMVMLHLQYASHLLLITLMLVGSLIDADEKIIPDTITVTGTLFALAIAAVYPWSLLPELAGPPGLQVFVGFLTLTSPNPWPAWLGGFPHAGSLALGLGCWWLWCAGLMERTWHSRYGWRRALRYFVAGLMRRRSTWQIIVIGLVGSAGILALWGRGGPCWMGLLTASVGMAASGGLIWAVRVIGTAVLGREAMGFGDVTLMAMIGAFLGWQSCLMVFFLAPLAGLVIGLVGLIVRRQSEIPYGPFLCLAALVVIIRWAALWGWAAGIFAMGLFVPLVILFCLFLMAVMLAFWRAILALFH